MCGIAGVFGLGSRDEVVTAMVNAQHHRGPDMAGVYIDPE
jgi:asparagine synthetase B (glutamine-hydrolysing)